MIVMGVARYLQRKALNVGQAMLMFVFVFVLVGVTADFHVATAEAAAAFFAHKFKLPAADIRRAFDLAA